MIGEQLSPTTPRKFRSQSGLVGVEGTALVTRTGQIVYRCLGYVSPKAGRRKLRALYRGKSPDIWLKVFALFFTLVLAHGLLLAVAYVGASRLLGLKMTMLSAAIVGITASLIGVRLTVMRYGELGRADAAHAGAWFCQAAGFVWTSGDVERVLGGHLSDMDDRIDRLGAHQTVITIQREVWRCRLLMARELIQLGCTETMRYIRLAF